MLVSYEKNVYLAILSSYKYSYKGIHSWPICICISHVLCSKTECKSSKFVFTTGIWVRML